MSKKEYKSLAEELNEKLELNPPIDTDSDGIEKEIIDSAELLEDGDKISQQLYDFYVENEVDLPAKIKIEKTCVPTVNKSAVKPEEYAEAKNRKSVAPAKEKPAKEKPAKEKPAKEKPNRKAAGKSKYGARLGSVHARLDELFDAGMHRKKMIADLKTNFPEKYNSKDGDRLASNVISQHITDLRKGCRTNGRSVIATEDSKGFIKI